eukprot:CAMPEP_0202886216 /NCGR_PEP_ID=MMETSP1391-20130828/42060_1 /ASSEMBLY_ACC=CAM_ASM_000867 /TAXON_ID=1034604 /ORGANISM="Chlamydomonas leiostraca, Strain SAG 11-49" /LENGTH=972 /DNA_ID=CAMNT_0049569485 /DNA_START=65 /DNA_END=2985 /DNA_ORIENTATION=+
MGNAGSALHVAVQKGNLSDFYVAVQNHAAYINEPESELGYTPLHLAARMGRDAMVKELVRRGADPNRQDKEGRTPLMLGCLHGHAGVVDALVRHPATRRDLRDARGQAAYDLALPKRPDLANRVGPAPPAPAPAAPPAAAYAAGSTASQPLAGGRPPAPSSASAPPQPAAPHYYPPVPGMQISSAPSYQPTTAPAATAPAAAAAAPPSYYDYLLAGSKGQQAAAQHPSAPAPAQPPPTTYYQPASPVAAHTPATPTYYAQPPPAPAPARPSWDAQASAPPGPSWPTYAPSAPTAPAGPPTYPAPPSYPAPTAGAPAPAATAPPPSTSAGFGRVSSGATAAADDDWAPAPADDWGGQEDTPSAGASGGEEGGRKHSAGAKPPGHHQLGSTLKSAADIALLMMDRLKVGQPFAGRKPGLPPLPGTPTAAQPRPPGTHEAGGDGPGFRLPAWAQPLTNALAGAVGAGGGGSSAGGASTGSTQSTSGGGVYSGPAGRVYTYNALATATEYFAAKNKVGEGGFGPVYRGVLDGIPVAVKVMDTSADAMQGLKEFGAEVSILSRLHHPHVVLLIGSCPDKGLLVYEYLENGSLEDHLFRGGPPGAGGGQDGAQHARGGGAGLAWQERVRVAAEVASALLYLHSAPEPIVHMDLKPANVLLDRNLTAKLGDVGLSRLCPPPGAAESGMAGGVSGVQDTRLVGTLAFVDPEYLRTGQFSPRSDTYALGVMMLQLLTGQDGSQVVALVEGARNDGDGGRFTQVLDRRAGAWPAAEAMAFADMALKCVEMRRQDRPDLRSVVLPALLQLRQRTTLYPRADSKVADSTGGGLPPGMGYGAAGEAPAMFLCPITQDVMDDPVVAADGYTYEREAIRAWLSKSPTSPLTNLALEHCHLVPNLNLRSAIREWQGQAAARGSSESSGSAGSWVKGLVAEGAGRVLLSYGLITNMEVGQADRLLLGASAAVPLQVAWLWQLALSIYHT